MSTLPYCEKLFSYVHAMNVALDSCLVFWYYTHNGLTVCILSEGVLYYYPIAFSEDISSFSKIGMLFTNIQSYFSNGVSTSESKCQKIALNDYFWAQLKIAY